MLTSKSSAAMTQSRPSLVRSMLEMNPTTSFTNTTTGVKRHAGYGTGPDLAPGGAH